MQPFQLDENFLNDLGLGGLPDDQKQAFLGHVLETLELRVGTKLSEGLSEEQLTEFEKLTPSPEDTPEVQVEKQQQALAWLEANRPDYKDVVANEMEALKGEIQRNSNAILGMTN
ncbi:hypothetical protein JNJ66_05655 [Candidatus Saccharibacteria bacterium]|nr:hypothetical protein [Candidatus Saccharibacteria bacterium]